MDWSVPKEKKIAYNISKFKKHNHLWLDGGGV